jgi:S1-C subfamily serine protease
VGVLLITVILCCTSLAYPGALRSGADLFTERKNSVVRLITLNFERPSSSGDRMNQALMAAQNQEDPPICGWIGVEAQPMTRPFADSLGMTELYGAIFDRPKANGPAAQANIEAGDVVTAINGSPLASWSDFTPTISAMAPGTAVYLTTYRDGQLIDVKVILGYSQCPRH